MKTLLIVAALLAMNSCTNSFSPVSKSSQTSVIGVWIFEDSTLTFDAFNGYELHVAGGTYERGNYETFGVLLTLVKYEGDSSKEYEYSVSGNVLLLDGLMFVRK